MLKVAATASKIENEIAALVAEQGNDAYESDR